jgi:hypothetical protein
MKECPCDIYGELACPHSGDCSICEYKNKKSEGENK